MVEERICETSSDVDELEFCIADAEKRMNELQKIKKNILRKKAEAEKAAVDERKRALSLAIHKSGVEFEGMFDEFMNKRRHALETARKIKELRENLKGDLVFIGDNYYTIKSALISAGVDEALVLSIIGKEVPK